MKRMSLLVGLLLLSGAGRTARATCLLCEPIAVLYDQVAAPILVLEAPILDPLAGRAETGPAVFLTWTNPFGPPGEAPPSRLEVLRASSGGELREVWACDEPVDGCHVQSYRDAAGLQPQLTYDYQVRVSDGIGVGISNVESVRLPVEPPGPLSVVRNPDGALELSWSASLDAAGHRITRIDVVTGETQTVDVSGAVPKYIDGSVVAGSAYAYEVSTCLGTADQLDCSLGSVSSPARAAVGGDAVIHGLEEWVSRHRFRPDDALVDVADPTDPFQPSQRLLFRDEATGARVAKLTSGPHRDFHLYSNIPVWSADGSRLLFQAGEGPHVGWRVMNADGTELRDIEIDTLDVEEGSLPASWWDEAGVGLRWSYGDPDRLYYADGSGRLGWLRPPSALGAQQDGGVFWTAPESPDQNFWLTLHPDGTTALGVDGVQVGGVAAGEGSTAYVVDLGSGATEAVVAIGDESGVPGYVHQIWFTKASDHAFTFHFASRAGQWVVDDPASGSASIDKRSDLTWWRAGLSPDGSRAAHVLGVAVGLTDVEAGTTDTILDRLGGHNSWDVDEDWFVASGRNGLWRIWVDGHATRVATPYTDLVYEGETHAAFMPQLSPDGTKIAFKSPMLGNIDLYYAIAKLPEPPRDLAFDGATLVWSAPIRAREIARYNVWESTASGFDFALVASVDAAMSSYEPVDAAGRFYRVTAAEHSDLEGLPSNEATLAVGTHRRYWIEPHRGHRAGDPGAPPSMAPVFEGGASALYHLEALRAGVDTSDAVSVDVPTGSFWVWASIRGGGDGAALSFFDGLTGLGAIAAGQDDWTWARIPGPTTLVTSTGKLALVPSAAGIGVDQLLLTTDPDFVPVGPASTLSLLPSVPPSVAGLTATASSFRCELGWDAITDPDAIDFSHFNVYAGSEPAPAVQDPRRLVASVRKPAHTDWGLVPDTLYSYRIGAVDRWGREGPPAEATCRTDDIDFWEFREIPEDSALIPLTDPGAGLWRFSYDIPATASPAEFVAWLRIHSASGQPLESVYRSGVEPALIDWDLASQLTPVTRRDGGPPERDTRMWIVLPLANGAEVRPVPLAAGPGTIAFGSAGDPPHPDASIRVSGFVLTNDLSYVPDGISGYLLPDARVGITEGPASAACDDGLDNDGDGFADQLFDPGCDDVLDDDERSAALPCDDGVDNDLDGEADLDDPGCDDVFDSSEQTPLAQCDDGIDNDDDGSIDSLDPDCAGPSTLYEEIPECDDGVDNDGDGFVDHPVEPGCLAPADRSERYDCGDGIDNDRDGLTDHPDDLGCESAASERENPACSDGVDNDGDGRIDFAGGPGGEDPDPACAAGPHWFHETQAELVLVGCGLGYELIAPLVLAMGLRRRWRRRRRTLDADAGGLPARRAAAEERAQDHASRQDRGAH